MTNEYFKQINQLKRNSLILGIIMGSMVTLALLSLAFIIYTL